MCHNLAMMRHSRVSASHTAICNGCDEPNRALLPRRPKVLAKVWPNEVSKVSVLCVLLAPLLIAARQCRKHMWA